MPLQPRGSRVSSGVSQEKWRLVLHLYHKRLLMSSLTLTGPNMLVPLQSRRSRT